MANAPKPIDSVFSLAGGIAQTLANPTRAYVNLADGEPAMPAPWHPRMKLEGAMLYAHPVRERVLMHRLGHAPLRRI